VRHFDPAPLASHYCGLKTVLFPFSSSSHRSPFGNVTAETLLYFVDSGRISKITLPDFVLNILGRQGAIHAKFKNSVVSFVKFLPDNLCLLFTHVEPDSLDETRDKPRADAALSLEPGQGRVDRAFEDPGQPDLVQALEPGQLISSTNIADLLRSEAAVLNWIRNSAP